MKQCQMPKFDVQIKSEIQMTNYTKKIFAIEPHFDIDLTFGL
jgi:hypothetical protein